MDIYERIDTLLKIKGMSRRKLAEKAGIPISTLSSAFARKSKRFSSDLLSKIATELDISVDVLLGNKRLSPDLKFDIEDLNELSKWGNDNGDSLESDIAYLELVAEMQKEKISAKDLELALEFVKRLREADPDAET